MAGVAHLVICSKSTWAPAIRREHALAALAAGAGVQVTFIERPLDVRALRSPAGARRFLSGARRQPPAETPLPGVTVRPSSVLVPWHRGRAADVSATALLRRQLRAIPGIEQATIVAGVPWQWPAVAAVPAARRVFDVADDWSRQIPGRAEWIDGLYARIQREADAIVLVNPDMAARLSGPDTRVVRNGVAAELLVPVTPPPTERRMVWTGTLSERFDAGLAGEVLQRAEGWSLDLYGQCQYAGRGSEPDDELAGLLAAYPGRVTLHGVIPRAQLAAAIDRASVAVIFNRVGLTRGQDSMKLYDYAARGRPIVATRFGNTTDADAPPHMWLADGAVEIAAALTDAVGEPPEHARERRAWAELHTWPRRWESWSPALFPEDPGAALRRLAETHNEN